MKLCVHVLKDDNGYVAFCSTLPGCRVRGMTRDDARDKLNDAIRGYVAAVNNFVPENLTEEIVEV